MLAGYLPFDDDPANPEGDNINLLYKYIVNTPLTFPEYVTPHARDLLRRILVPNPRKRADLFEVARHSWLSEYAHVVELITSATTTPSEIQNTTITSDDVGDTPVLARSNSVRESSKKATQSPALGGLTTKQGNIDPEAEQVAYIKAQKDAKRRTVQVEYVAPRTQTQRGEPTQTSSGKARARSGSQDPVEVRPPSSSKEKPLPRDPPVSRATGGPVGSRRPPSAHQNITASNRPTRDSQYMATVSATPGQRPPTGGSMQSNRSQGGRASYGQPLAPEVADTNVHGRIQQPARGNSTSYGMPSPSLDQGGADYMGRPSISVPDKFARVSGFAGEGQFQGQPRPSGRPDGAKGHRRSNTLGEISGKIFGRSGSIFGRKKAEKQQPGEKPKRYPPVSMNNSMPGGNDSRPSVDTTRSRRSFSQALGRKRSGSVSGSQASYEKSNRRFSLLKAIGIGKDSSGPTPQLDSQQDLPIHEPPQVDQYGRYIDQHPDRDQTEVSTLEGMYSQLQLQDPAEQNYRQAQQQRVGPQEYAGRPAAVSAYNPQGAVLTTGSESSFDNHVRRPTGSAPYTEQQPQVQYSSQQPYDNRRMTNTGRENRGVLQKPKRGFVDAWDTDESSKHRDHSGSSGPARKVMDFFRRRGKARGGEDR
jgi:protein-serine/threonine kinase